MADKVVVEGYVIVPPLSPWDKEHRDEIWGYLSCGTFGKTAGEAWTRHMRLPAEAIYRGEASTIRQRWMDRGYRLCRATIILHPEASN